MVVAFNLHVKKVQSLKVEPTMISGVNGAVDYYFWHFILSLVSMRVYFERFFQIKEL